MIIVAMLALMMDFSLIHPFPQIHWLGPKIINALSFIQYWFSFFTILLPSFKHAPICLFHTVSVVLRTKHNMPGVFDQSSRVQQATMFVLFVLRIPFLLMLIKIIKLLGQLCVNVDLFIRWLSGQIFLEALPCVKHWTILGNMRMYIGVGKIMLPPQSCPHPNSWNL